MYSHNFKGFTLIEVLLALLIGCLVISGLLATYWSSSRAYDWGLVSSDNQYMARRAISDITKDIKESSQLEINSNANILILNKDETNEIRYYIQTGNLIRYHDNSHIPIAENVKELKLCQDDVSGLVEVEVEIVSRNKDYRLTTQIFPHNCRP